MQMQYSKTSSRRKERQLQREIKLLSAAYKRRGGKDDGRASHEREFARQIVYNESQIVARAIASEVEENGENWRVLRLRKRLQQLSKINGYDLSYEAQNSVRERLSTVAESFVAQKYAPRKDNARLKRLQARINRLASASGSNVADVLKTAERQRADNRIFVIANLLAEEVAAGRAQEKTHRVLDAELDVLVKRAQYKKAETTNSQFVQKLRDLTQQAATEKYKRDSDAVKVAELELRIARLKKALGPYSDDSNWIQRNALIDALQTESDNYLSEVEKLKPNPRELAASEKHIARLYTDPEYVAPTDSYYGSQVNGQGKLPKDKPPFESAKFQAIRGIYERARQQSDDADLAPLNKAERERLAADKAAAFDKLQYATKYFLRLGDPLISLDAPQNAQSVVAVMPDGTVKRLLWNATNRKWQARFDIPSHATPGEYSIALIVVLQSGQRIKTTMRYTVDMTSPEGVARAQIVTSSNATHSLRLELETGDQSARVVALLPWGERVELKPSAQNKNRFFALSTPPAAWTKSEKVASAVTYIITDKAHNRTTITVDMTQ